MSIPLSNARVGVYVDSSNVTLLGGHGMRYDVLREFAGRDGAECVRMNVYVAVDAERASGDGGYRRGQENFCAVLRDFGYKVVQRPLRRSVDESGNRYEKAPCDLAMAVDVLRQAENLERVLLVTGDPAFADVVHALQSRGLRVEVVSFDPGPSALREEADLFVSGWVVPNLLPISGQSRADWGEVGSRVRGVCYNHSGKGYGFLRYVREIKPGMWITDSRHPDSPYETVFFHDSQLPRNVPFHRLPSREHVFEFELTESDRFEDDVQAIDLRLVGAARRAEEARGDRNGRGAPEAGRDDVGEEETTAAAPEREAPEDPAPAEPVAPTPTREPKRWGR